MASSTTKHAWSESNHAISETTLSNEKLSRASRGYAAIEIDGEYASTTMHAWSDYVMPESERTLSNSKLSGNAAIEIDGNYSYASISDYTNINYKGNVLPNPLIITANLGKAARI